MPREEYHPGKARHFRMNTRGVEVTALVGMWSEAEVTRNRPDIGETGRAGRQTA